MPKEDKSQHIPQATKLKDAVDIKSKYKLTSNQNLVIEKILDKNTKCIFLSGVAGTAKTYSAILAGLQLLNRKQVSSIIYVRSAVESSDSKLGYLPGDIDSKIQPYLEPLMDKLSELLSKNDIDKLLKDKRIETKAISFLRGLSWNAKFIINDECQNASFKEIVTIITRLGEFSKIILCGDPTQSDINGKSGFKDMMNLFNNQESMDNGIFCFDLAEDDIVRSKFVKFVVGKLNLFKNAKSTKTNL